MHGSRWVGSLHVSRLQPAVLSCVQLPLEVWSSSGWCMWCVLNVPIYISYRRLVVMLVLLVEGRRGEWHASRGVE